MRRRVACVLRVACLAPWVVASCQPPETLLEVATPSSADGAGEQAAPAPPASVLPAGSSAPALGRTTIVVGAIGDNTLGGPIGPERARGSFQFAHEESGRDFARPFSKVVSVLADDDLTIGNLEGPLTAATCVGQKAFVFRGDPAYAEMLRRGSVELVTLANNHSEDCGPRGVGETREALVRHGVGHFGLGVVDKRVVKGVEVVNLGFAMGEPKLRARVARDVAQHKQPGNLVFVSFHWGVEGSTEFVPFQQTIGRAAIDAGADLVLGHHPHRLQGIEVYRGRRIVYSLGNFVFGGNSKPGDLDTMIFRARFTFDGARLVETTHEIVPARSSGTSPLNDFRPVLVTGPEGDAIRRQVEAVSPPTTPAPP